MFVHVENHHTKFEKVQTELIDNQIFFKNTISNMLNRQMMIYTNQLEIQEKLHLHQTNQ